MDMCPPGARTGGLCEVAGYPLMGGVGIVYTCLDRQENRPVALKTFRPHLLPDRADRDRFLREGTTWFNLGRLHIVRAYEVERIGNGREVYLVLELVAKEEEHHPMTSGDRVAGIDLCYQAGEVNVSLSVVGGGSQVDRRAVT